MEVVAVASVVVVLLVVATVVAVASVDTVLLVLAVVLAVASVDASFSTLRPPAVVDAEVGVVTAVVDAVVAVVTGAAVVDGVAAVVVVAAVVPLELVAVVGLTSSHFPNSLVLSSEYPHCICTAASW